MIIWTIHLKFLSAHYKDGRMMFTDYIKQQLISIVRNDDIFSKLPSYRRLKEVRIKNIDSHQEVAIFTNDWKSIFTPVLGNDNEKREIEKLKDVVYHGLATIKDDLIDNISSKSFFEFRCINELQNDTIHVSNIVMNKILVSMVLKSDYSLDAKEDSERKDLSRLSDSFFYRQFLPGEKELIESVSDIVCRWITDENIFRFIKPFQCKECRDAVCQTMFNIRTRWLRYTYLHTMADLYLIVDDVSGVNCYNFQKEKTLDELKNYVGKLYDQLKKEVDSLQFRLGG